MMLHTAELDTQIHTNHLTLTLDEDEVGVHTFQYLGHSLSRERPVFQVNVTRLSKCNFVLTFSIDSWLLYVDGKFIVTAKC